LSRNILISVSLAVTLMLAISFLRARLRIFLDWIEKESPDILCLQETKVPDNVFPEKDFEGIGFHAVFRGEKTFNRVNGLRSS
jgi:exodeoxyribonuclease-3